MTVMALVSGPDWFGLIGWVLACAFAWRLIGRRERDAAAEHERLKRWEMEHWDELVLQQRERFPTDK